MGHVTSRKTSCSLAVAVPLAAPSLRRRSSARDPRVWVNLAMYPLAGLVQHRAVASAWLAFRVPPIFSAQGPSVWAHQRGPRAGAVFGSRAEPPHRGTCGCDVAVSCIGLKRRPDWRHSVPNSPIWARAEVRIVRTWENRSRFCGRVRTVSFPPQFVTTVPR